MGESFGSPNFFSYLYIMKQIYILIFTSEVNNINGFFDRKEMLLHEAVNRNSELTDLIWVLTPNN
jgi:hypothetical protein